MIRLIAYFFCFIASLHFYVNAGHGFGEKPEKYEVHTVPTFDDMVERWSMELDAIAPVVDLGEASGNCLEVAVELQKRIVATGRMAVIPLVKYEGKIVGHVLVMYDSDKDGRFDSVIDNGYETNHRVMPREALYNNELGNYVGLCEDVDLEYSSCGTVGLRI